MRLLTMREHSRAELERKLSRTRKAGDLPPDRAELAAMLDELQTLGLLDEQRFAESLVRRRSVKYGSQRIGQELRMHGLDEGTVSGALDALNAPLQDDLARALRILRKRHPEPVSSPQEHARQQRFLAARGFPHDVIRQAMKLHAATHRKGAMDDAPDSDPHEDPQEHPDDTPPPDAAD
ncbi:regulatory protein RecX [Thiomonas sp. X19]|uniref:regulatory protein RecX n=1 Tax=Thiomonas sp. X19 TaxID=1050370 RepID=UPI001E5E004D|nr:regulatory protein RecX [Thiomonas sp. X19]